MTFRTVIFLSAVFILLSFSSVLAGEFEFEYQKIIPRENSVELTVDIPKGNLKFYPSNDNRIIINAVKRIKASSRNEAEEVADHIEIKVTNSKNKVRVSTHFLKMLNRSNSFWRKFIGGGEDSFGDVDFEIAIPLETNLILNVSSGRIEIVDHDGSVNITSGSMDMIKVEYNRGPISIACEHAEIDLQWIEGDIRVKSQMGKINIKQLSGSINLKTSSSPVKIETELATDKNYFVETTSGEIFFSVPVSASGYLDIDSKAGEIKTDVPIAIKSMSRNRLIGVFGGGGTKISLTSMTGDVEVNQY